MPLKNSKEHRMSSRFTTIPGYINSVESIEGVSSILTEFIAEKIHTRKTVPEWARRAILVHPEETLFLVRSLKTMSIRIVTLTELSKLKGRRREPWY